MFKRLLKSLFPPKDLLAHFRQRALRELLVKADAAEVHAPAKLNLKKEVETA